jgi:hypothetical protein
MASKKRELKLSADALNALDKQIQELVLLDFDVFCKTLGIDKTKAFVCFEIKKKKSATQIGMKLNISKQRVYIIAKGCP